MNPFLRTTTILVISILALACTDAATSSMEQKIQGKWLLEKVIYEDGSDKTFAVESGNYLEIDSTSITEVWGDSGKRTLNHQGVKDTKLIVDADGQIQGWSILSVDEHNLQLQSPLGLYVLKRL